MPQFFATLPISEMPAFLPVSPLAHAAAGTPHHPAVCTSPRMDAEAPPESRISPSYPRATRFEAPCLAFLDVPGFPLLNNVGLNQREIPLDLEAAAAITRSYVTPLLLGEPEEGVFPLDALFDGRAADVMASSVAEKYYPLSRRDETPIISVGSDNESLQVAAGAVQATPPEESETAGHPLDFLVNVPPSPQSVVDKKYPKWSRYLAPEITFATMGLSVGMTAVKGEPEAELYGEDRRNMAPEIRMKKEMFNGDLSAFIEVANVEVQLPIIKTF